MSSFEVIAVEHSVFHSIAESFRQVFAGDQAAGLVLCLGTVTEVTPNSADNDALIIGASRSAFFMAKTALRAQSLLLMERACVD